MLRLLKLEEHVQRSFRAYLEIPLRIHPRVAGISRGTRENAKSTFAE